MKVQDFGTYPGTNVNYVFFVDENGFSSELSGHFQMTGEHGANKKLEDAKTIQEFTNNLHPESFIKKGKIRRGTVKAN